MSQNHYISVQKNSNKKGYLFAGWYQDAEFKIPADLSNVQKNTTVYARYISDNYFAVNFEVLGSGKNPNKVRISCMADSQMYAEMGFEITINGKTEKVVGMLEKKPEQKAKVMGSTKRVEKKKNDKDSEIKVTADINVKKYGAGTEITVRPYYVTADGTVCYGTSQMIQCR